MELLARRLVETVAWCGLRPRSDDPARDLRSRELQPEGLRAPPHLPFPHTACEPSYSAGRPLAELTSPEVHAMVDRVGAVRATLLQGLAGGSPIDLSTGRLLAFEPIWSVWDGASEFESAGYFDGDDTPPWDTWVAWIERGIDDRARQSRGDGYLLCWVPAPLIACVERGIYVNPVECILWADTLDPALVARLIEDAARLAR